MPQKNRQDRIVAFEVLRRSLRIRELILNGEDEERTFTQVVSSSQAAGMFTFEHSLSRLYQGGLISEEVALLNASDKPGLKRRIEEIKAARGELDTDIKGLEVDWNYEDKVLPGRDKRG
jgi:twitching motility protein PilT